MDSTTSTQLRDSFPTLFQLDQPHQRLGDFDRLLASLHLVISIPDVDRFRVELVLTHD